MHDSKTSRDERNAYFNMTVERTSRILDVLNANLRTVVEDAGNASLTSFIAGARTPSSGFFMR